MKKKFNYKKLIKFILQILIYFAVFYFIYDRLVEADFVQFEEGKVVVLKGFTFFNPKWLYIAIGVYSLHSLWNAVTWFKMMKLSGEKVNLLEQMNVYLKSDILRYIPGNVVGILSRGVYNKEYGVKMAKSLWGWFLENVIYLVLGIIIGSYVITMLDIEPFYVYLTVTVAVVGGIFGILKIDWLEFIFGKIVAKKLPEGEKVEDHTLKIDFLGRIILITRYTVSWLITLISFILVVYAVDGFDASNLFVLASIYAMARSIGYLAIITPTGGGIREAVIFQLLTMVNGYSAAIATVIAIITRVIFILGELLSYVIFYTYYMFYKLLFKTKR